MARAEQPRQPRVFRSGVDLVRFSVAVTTPRGGFVHGLTADDFQILEDGKPQSIVFFHAGRATTPEGDPAALGEPLAALHLGLLFDTSESMVDDIRFSQNAAVKFLDALPEAHDITFVDFDTEVRVARYSQTDFPRLVERIRSTRSKGWTALHDALGVYLDGAFDQDGDKALVLYTDGGDTRSNLDFGGALELLRASDVTVFAIGLLTHQSGSVRTEQRMRLEQIATTTGGLAFFPTGKEQLDEMYARIVAELRARYSIGYLSTNTKTDGGWRKVQIKLTRPDLKDARVRTRQGYFAPYRE